MRIVRYTTSQDAQPQYGWVYEGRVGRLEGSPFAAFSRQEPQLPLETVRLLAPATPSKIVCIGRNYVAHAQEHQAEVPKIPLIFLKPPSSIIAHGDTILLPPQSQRVEHEAELAVVIGRRARWLTPENALEHVLGYTIANDVTARDLQYSDGQWTRGKGFDTFCPFGPWLETEFNPADTLITCKVNGETRQMASTRDMVFDVQQLLIFISSVMTLEPGDMILTGTPAGVSPLKAGDIVTVSIEGLGTLENPVQNEPAH
ncbi:MAG: fumarylacetoacetate hydrolase family protein [Anaerolineales bacterium]